MCKKSYAIKKDNCIAFIKFRKNSMKKIKLENYKIKNSAKM